MSQRDRASGWVSVVLRDYGPEAWHDDEHAVRRDAEFVVLDPEALARQCALLRNLGATPGAQRWAVAEVLLRGMDEASPEAIRAVMADPAALCDVHFNAWTSAGSWAEAVRRYRLTRSASTRRPSSRKAATAEGPSRRDVKRWGPPTWVSTPVILPAADSDDRGALAVTPAAVDPDGHEFEHEIVLGGSGSRAEIRGTLRLWRARGDGQSHSWWLMIRFPAVAGRSGDDPRRDIMAEYRNRSVFVECPGLHEVPRFKVLLLADDGGGLISDRYFLENIDPTREGFAFKLGLDPGSATGRRG
jgi:hypothetical protein